MTDYGYGQRPPRLHRSSAAARDRARDRVLRLTAGTALLSATGAGAVALWLGAGQTPTGSTTTSTSNGSTSSTTTVTTSDESGSDDGSGSTTSKTTTTPSSTTPTTTTQAPVTQSGGSVPH